MLKLSSLIKKTVPQPFYLLKCLVGVTICYILFKVFPGYPFYWAIISVVVAMAPDHNNQLAYDRMKANLLGCAVGVGFYPLHWPELVVVCVGIVLIIAIGYALKVTSTLRSAMAALIIVTIHEQGLHQWLFPLERVVCVVAGCLVALLVTLPFNIAARSSGKEAAVNTSEGG